MRNEFAGPGYIVVRTNMEDPSHCGSYLTCREHREQRAIEKRCVASYTLNDFAYRSHDYI